MGGSLGGGRVPPSVSKCPAQVDITHLRYVKPKAKAGRAEGTVG